MVDFAKLLRRDREERAAVADMRVAPFKHQVKEYVAHRFTRSRALLWQMRTGKTKEVIDTACALYQACEIEAVIVIAPNGVHRNWTLKQLPLHHWNAIPFAAFAWRFKDRRNNDNFKHFMTQSAFSWFALNMEALIHDDVNAALKAFIKAKSRFLFVVDESHHFAVPGTRRTSVARGLAKRASYVRILTGTTMEDSPLQTYSQFEMLEKGALGYTNHESFKEHYAVYEQGYGRGRPYPVLKKYVNMTELRGRMAKYSSVVLRKDCDDLPDIQYDTRVVELEPSTRAIHEALKTEDVRVLMNFGFEEPPSGGALLTKLQQIEGGFLITPRGVAALNDNAKFNIVLEEIELYRFVVFCEYSHEIAHLQVSLNGAGIRCETIQGGNASTRDRTLDNFQHGRIQGVIAQSRAASEGYDLSAADKILWYSQTNSARVRAQGNERATAVGASAKQVIDIIAPGGVDEYYLKLTQTKTELADDIARRGLQLILAGLSI